MKVPDRELDGLIARYIDGRLSLEDETALRARLQDDAGARASFFEMLDLHAMLAGAPAVAGATLAAADLKSAAAPREGRIVLRRRAVWWSMAATILALAGIWHFQRTQVELVGGVGHRFIGRQAHAVGSDVVGRNLELSQGFVELLFRRSDATLVIEAPAQFRVEDAETLRLDSGRVTAHVRDGKQGLRVLTGAFSTPSECDALTGPAGAVRCRWRRPARGEESAPE